MVRFVKKMFIGGALHTTIAKITLSFSRFSLTRALSDITGNSIVVLEILKQTLQNLKNIDIACFHGLDAPCCGKRSIKTPRGLVANKR